MEFKHFTDPKAPHRIFSTVEKANEIVKARYPLAKIDAVNNRATWTAFIKEEKVIVAELCLQSVNDKIQSWKMRAIWITGR